MTQITLSVDDKKVRQSLKILGTKGPKIFNDNLNDALELAAKRIKRYPAKLPNQKYKRTFRFRDSVKVTKAKRKSGKGKYYREARLETKAKKRGSRKSYSVWVTGDAKGLRQATIHKGRWKVAKIEVTKAAKPLIAKTEKKIAAELKKVAGGR